jgi:hypothetical protein
MSTGDIITLRPLTARPSEFLYLSARLEMKNFRRNKTPTDQAIANAIRALWPDNTQGVYIATMSPIYFHVKIVFTKVGTHNFPNIFTFDNNTTVHLARADDCKICHSHAHPTEDCEYKKRRPHWKVGLGETNDRENRRNGGLAYAEA